MTDGKEQNPPRKPLQVEVTIKPGEPEKPGKKGLNLKETIQTIVSLVIIFGALCYLLGRYYLEAYYNALGISRNVLDISTNDYMFSSFIMIIMCLVVSLCLYLFWMLKESYGKIGRYIRLFGNVKFGLIVLGVWAVCFVILFLSVSNTGLTKAGLSGGCAGLIIGIPIFVFAVLADVFLVRGKINSSKEKKRPRFIRKMLQNKVVIFILVLLYMGICLPFVTGVIAESRVKSNIEDFPPVIVVGKTVFPSPMPASVAENSTEGKLVMTNNGNTYILSDNITGKDGWHIFAIPVESIQDIIYIHQKDK